MEFTTESQTVKSYVLLIEEKKRTLDEVPALFNLKEVVAQCLEK